MQIGAWYLHYKKGTINVSYILLNIYLFIYLFLNRNVTKDWTNFKFDRSINKMFSYISKISDEPKIEDIAWKEWVINQNQLEKGGKK